jgi:hypothetical protein
MKVYRLRGYVELPDHFNPTKFHLKPMKGWGSGRLVAWDWLMLCGSECCGVLVFDESEYQPDRETHKWPRSAPPHKRKH